MSTSISTRVRLARAAFGMTALATAAALAAPAFAGGFYLQEQSVRGAGRAYSGEAADTGPASLWWNPASIAGAPREVYTGTHAILTSSKVTDTGSTLSRSYPVENTTAIGGDRRSFEPLHNGVVPNFAASTPIGDRFAIGFVAAAPYNFITDYDNSSFVRYNAGKSRLTSVDLQPTVAVKVTDWLSVGAGFDAEYVNSRLTSNLPGLLASFPDGNSALKGDGWDYGWDVGAQAHYGKFSLGASYRSKIDHTLDGHATITGLLGPLAAANGTSDAKAKFTTPWMAIVGARYALTDQLTLNAQLQRTGWSEFKNIKITSASNETFVEDYKDTWTGAVGADFAVNPGVTLRAGVGYDQTPTRDRSRDARVPDADRWLFSAGFTVPGPLGSKLDGAFQYVLFKDSHLNKDETIFGGTGVDMVEHLRGDVTGNAVILSAGSRWQF